MQIRTADKRLEYRATIANPGQQWGSTAPPSNGSLGTTTSGTRIDTHTALQLAAVFGSVNLIADAIGTLPIRQWKLTNGEPIAIDSSPIIEQPWSEISQRDFIVQGTTSFLLRGNLWGRIAAFDDLMRPAQVQIIPPDFAKAKRLQSGNGIQPAGAIEVRYYNEIVPPDLVTRGMALQLPGAIEGLNPIAYMRNTLGVALAQDLSSGAFFANQARPDGVITVKGDLDINEAKAMKASWLEAFQGINHSFLPAILSGDTTYQPIAMNRSDAQFLEQMQYSASVISGMIYRVPPHMLGMVDKDTSWGAGIEQQELGFVRNTLLIWLARWEDLMTSWLPRGQFVTFDLSGRLRGDTLQRWSAYQIARVIGAMNNLQVMKAEGIELPTDPATLAILSDYAAPLNSSPVKPTSTGGAGGDKSD